MKIKSKLVAVFCSLLFFSCSNDNVTSLKVASVLSIKDYAEQKVEYSLLTANEKFTVWDDKMNLLLESNDLNTSQKELIRELKNTINPKFFEIASNDEKEYFKDIFVKNYLNRIDKNFNRDEIDAIFYSVTIKQSFKPNNTSKTSIYAPRISCDCNLGSLFGCGANDGCRKSNCETPLQPNCGFLWLWDCNGGCINYI